MAFDGSIKIDTKLDTAGMQAGLKKMVSGIELSRLLLESANNSKPTAENEGNDIGKYLAQGVSKGINSNTIGVEQATAGMLKNALERAKKSMEIHSPSHVMRDEVGRYIAEGVAVGISDYDYKVSDAFSNMLEDLELKRDMGVIDEAEYYKQLSKLRDEHIKKGTADWWKYTKDIIKYKEDEQARAQESELSELKRLREREIITDEQYYRRLLEHRDKWFDTASEKWREYSDEILDYLKSEKEKISDAYNSLSDEVDNKISAMTEKLSNGDLYDKVVSKYKSLGTGEEYSVTSINLHNFDNDIALIDGVDLSECTSVSTMFSCSQLVTLELTGTIPNLNLDLQYCPRLSHDSLIGVINALSDGASSTLTLGETNLAKLTDAEKAIATNKGWTLA